MDHLTAILLGLGSAAGATVFPGMLNMTSVSVSLRAGRGAAYQFAAGMSVTLAVQAGVAVFFARYLTDHPVVLHSLREWAVLLFILLAVFFTIKGYRARVAKIPSDVRPYRGNPFLGGAALAVMNLLTIPYFFALSGYLLAQGWLVGGWQDRLLYTFGAGAGAMIIFCGYAHLAGWMQRNARFLTRNINFFLGGLLFILAVVQGIRVYG